MARCTTVLRVAMHGAWLALALGVAGLVGAAPSDVADILTRADQIKTSDNAGFKKLLEQASESDDRLTARQKSFLDYLQAWQIAYTGDYQTAIPKLTAIMDHGLDATIRFRAGTTAVNVLSISHHNEQAYARLNQLLDTMPSIADQTARVQALIVAAQLFDQAGQYDQAARFSEQILSESTTNADRCKGWSLKFEALSESGDTTALPDAFRHGIDACTQAGEPIFAGLIRYRMALANIGQGHPDEAIKLLQDHVAEIERTHYKPVVSAVQSALALAYWKTGDMANARVHAQRAIADAVQGAATEPSIDAYQVMFVTAKAQGDMAAALDWHEKFAAAQMGYLSDVSARALAYQMVHQQVAQKKAQIAALSQKNQVLKLQQDVAKQNMIVVRLGIALLLVVLGSIVLYAIRTKRSQVKFQKLARRDGLTEIHNRQYFIECAQAELAYCRKSMRDASVIAIDLDHFKQINDSHGHAAGDVALKAAVAACQKHLRSVDTFGRLGGEEFGILLPDCVPERAVDIAEKMRGEVAAIQGAQGGTAFPVTASFGVTAARWAGYDLVHLLAQADSALYQAKRDGRNRVALHGAPAIAAAGPPPGTEERRQAAG